MCGVGNNQNLATGFSSDLACTAQWGRNWLVRFSTSKIKLALFQHHREQMLSFLHYWWTVWLQMRLLVWNVCCDLRLHQSSNTTWVYDPLLKMMIKSVCSLYWSRKYLPFPVIALWLQKIKNITLLPHLVWICPILTFPTDWFQNYFHCLVDDELIFTF